MKKYKRWFLALIVVGVGIYVYPFLLPKNKIGYVETGVLLSQFVEAQNAQKEFQKFQQGFDPKLKSYQDSVQNLVQYMRKNENQAYVLNDSLQHLQDRFEKLQNLVYRQSKKKEEELMRPVLSKANQYILDWGKAQGYSIILGTMQGGNILYADTSLNVTSKILQDMNQDFKRLPEK